MKGVEEKTFDLTIGRVRQTLIQYALPLVVMNLMQSLYSMADLLISGHFIGSRGISGINNSSQVMLLVTQIAIGLSQGGNILIGQFFGAREEEARKETTNTLFYSFMILSLATAILLRTFASSMLMALGAPAYGESLAYLRICTIGTMFIFGYNALVAAVRGVGDSWRPMLIIIISTCANIVLDILFVGGLKMGTAGAGLATVIAQGISFVLILVHVLRSRDVFGICIRHPQIHLKRFARILALGIPCAIQMSLAGLSWLTVTRYINPYGVAASAGGGVAAKIKDFCLLFTLAISSATSTMVAQTLGADKYSRAKEILYEAMKITMLASMVLIVAVEAGAPLLVRLFTREADVGAVAVQNLRIEMIGQIFYAIFMIYHGFALGAGHTWFVLLSSFVNCILVRVVLVILLDQALGLTGVFLACMIAPASSVPIGICYVKSGIWRKKLNS